MAAWSIMRIFPMAAEGNAPGGPGISPSWTSSAKDMVSTALGAGRLWATFGYGIVNEVYWPSTGEPQIRDLGFIIKGPKGWTEIKRAARYLLTTPKPHVPLPQVVHESEDYRLVLEYLPHPLRDALLINFRLEGDGLTLYALLAPHLGRDTAGNSAHAGVDLTAQQGAVAVNLTADCGFSRTSAGYVGASDGWQDFDKNGEMQWSYAEAADGNIALMGELAASSGILALAFAETPEGARTLARSSLADDYGATRDMFIAGWDAWGENLIIPYTSPELARAATLSATVIKMHEDRTYAGAVVASLSVPWGQSHNDPGGYHLVWTRDAVEAALALVVAGKTDDALRVLAYLIGTQGDDGSWAQNYYPSGGGYWTGNQLDEVALPALLAAKLMAVGTPVTSRAVETMVRRAIGYIVRNGPMSDQDRWEENAGASPFTLSTTISALVATAHYFDAGERDYMLALADCWNERIESWTYVLDGPLSEAHNIAGYYIRLGPRVSDGGLRGVIDVRNRRDGRTDAEALVGLEFLYLVRTGLRRAHDPRIVDSVHLIDSLLRVETPSGPSFRRYNGDGYGEHSDGRPFDGTGRGRLWPLLTGERGHYAIAAGENAQPYLDAMSRMTGPGGLIPEQIWDTDPIPALGLYPGKPSGSAMPLVWAHAEFVKLLAAQANGRPAELFDAVESRWSGRAPVAETWFWRRNSLFRQSPRRRLAFEDPSPFTLAYSLDDGPETTLTSTPGHFGLCEVVLAPETLGTAGKLTFSLTLPDGTALTDTITFTG
jgi:glucoamylase